VIVRAASAADGPAIRALIESVLVEHGLLPDPSGIDADLVDVVASYHDRGGVFDVVEDEGVVVGTMGLLPLGEGTCELRKMYLAPTARGKGVGRTLLERAIAEARRRGFARMELETAAPLKRAMELYERFGFRRFEKAHIASRCDRAYVLEL
jgi:putative acetyltransferase